MHAHRWCIAHEDTPPIVVSCRCGLTVIGVAWAEHDLAAALQYVDPDGVQRAFCDAASIDYDVTAALRRHRPERVNRRELV